MNMTVDELAKLAREHGTDATNFYYGVRRAYEAYSDDLAKLKAGQDSRKMGRWLIGEDLRGYDPERHDPDSIFFDDSYVGPSERELNGGCNRCGGMDDCYCN